MCLSTLASKLDTTMLPPENIQRPSKRKESKSKNMIFGTTHESKPTKRPKLEHRSNGLVQVSKSSQKDHGKDLASFRKSLPISGHRIEIQQGLREKDVMLLVGETGSGKSTQVPQFLLNEEWCEPQIISPVTTNTKGRVAPTKRKIGGCIAVTEPRRVAAITLARRVAQEMGTPLGSASPASKVGYSVRFDNSTSPTTRIKFLTEGMLLQEMLRDPWLTAYSAVIVDEVHERGVDVDMVLGFLRQIIAGGCEGRGGVPLKVVVMSATADMELLEGFFEKAYPGQGVEKPLNGANGKAIELVDDISEWSGISNSEDETGPNPQNNTRIADHSLKKARDKLGSGIKDLPVRSLANTGTSREPGTRIATCHIQGRQFPVTIKYTPEPVKNVVDTALGIIFEINFKEPMPGDILVFLPGQETIESLESLIKEHSQGLRLDIPKLLALPLFAALPATAQQQVFNPAPAKTRKVIIATNIAETSVTVPGVRFVIDCGTAKIKTFRSTIGLEALLVKPISKSAAIQRKGRAGREAPGQCYRLYTEADYLTMQQSNTPEILRCDLARPILTMKARGVDDVDFPFLDQPPYQAFLKALEQLYQLGALTDTGTISEIGQKMAKLPLTVPLARVIVAATDPELNCLAEVIDIISCLSVENIFLNLASQEKKEEAEQARRELYRREGDHLTYLRTVQCYLAENTDRKAWTTRHFVSHRAMQAVVQVRKQLRQQFKSVLRENEKQGESPSSSELTADLAVSILKCFLTGFATNTARLHSDGSYKTVVGNQKIAIHPSSLLFGRKVEAIVYNEYVFTNKSYAKGVSAVQMGWVGEAFGVDE